MKRRRPEDDHGADLMPTDLEVCIVENWTGPDEVVLEAWESDAIFAREHLAFRRWCVWDLAEAARVYAVQLNLGIHAINHAVAVKLKSQILLADAVDAGQKAGEIRSNRSPKKESDPRTLSDTAVKLKSQILLSRAVKAGREAGEIAKQGRPKKNHRGSVVFERHPVVGPQWRSHPRAVA